MVHQFASIDCKHCNEHYCPVCKKECPNCDKDGIENEQYRRYVDDWRKRDEVRNKIAQLNAQEV